MRDELLNGEEFASVLEGARRPNRLGGRSTTTAGPTAASACSPRDSSPPTGKRGPNETHSPHIASTVAEW